jgi:uncharacterized membrane protein YdcZ (DUF606 family)
MTVVRKSSNIGGVLLLTRLRGWFLFGAVVICALLFAGLIHDFSQADPEAGWFTSRPIIPAVLLVAGYLLMVAHRFASARSRQ